MDERVLEDPERWVPGTCVLCSNGCAMEIGVRSGRIVGVRGRATDISNRGRLGPKGLHGWEANASPDRLTRPLIRRGGRLEEASWDEAMALLVRRSQELIARYSPLSIGLYTTGQLFLAEAFTAVAEKHRDEPDIPPTCTILAAWSREHAQRLQPLLNRYGEQPVVAPLVLHTVLFKGTRRGAHGLLRDLQDLALLASDVRANWAVLSAAAKALRDVELQTACRELSGQTLRQLDWLEERIAEAAPQALIAEG